MRKILNLIAMVVLMTAVAGYADTYDPSTNLLTIPSITVNGVTYTDVVVTVGKVVSIGSSSATPTDGTDRSCTGTIAGDSPTNDLLQGLQSFTYDLIVHPSTGTISVSMTGLKNTSSFSAERISLVQGSNSTEVSSFNILPGVEWVGNNFDFGLVPKGVIKSGTLSRFPPWFDFNQSFTWVDGDTGESFTC